jgi:DNA-binding beta-propeller fold protein YncE
VGRDGVVYISDTGNHRIRKYKPGTADKDGKPITDWVIGNGGQGFTDGDPATGADTAQVSGPSGIALTNDQTKLWVVDSGNHTIRLITLANRTVVTVAGKGGAQGDVDGSGETARFNTPKGCYAVGNDTLYVADSGNSKIRKVVLAGAVGTVTTVPFPNLFQPADVLGFGGFLFVSDEGRRTVERVAVGSETVEVLAQSDLPGFLDGDALTQAQFQSLADLLVLPTGEVLVADTGNNRIRKITKK